MSWPVAYRTPAAKAASAPTAPGGPAPGAQGPGSGYQKPPTPANDNWPKPANQNTPRLPSAQRPNSGFAKGARFAARLAGRSSPLLAGAVFGLAYYEFWKRVSNSLSPLDQLIQQRRYGPQAGWTETFRCTNPKSGPPFGPFANVHSQVCPNAITQSITSWNNNINKYQVIGAYPTGRYRAEVLYDQVLNGSFYQSNLGELWEHPMSSSFGEFNPAVVTPFWRHRPAINIPPLELPWPLPLVDPLILPVIRPLQAPRRSPRPRPARRANPYRAPSEQPQTGPRARPVPRTGPGTETVFPPQGRPRTRPIGPRLPRPPQRPPRGKKKEKEKKLRTGIPAGLIGKIVNAATETADVVDALYKALPKNVRGRAYWTGWSNTPQERAWVVFVNFHQIDWGKAADNLAKNFLEDAFFGGVVGRLGRAANQARGRFSPDGQSGVGVGTGGAGWLPKPADGASGIVWN